MDSKHVLVDSIIDSVVDLHMKHNNAYYEKKAREYYSRNIESSCGRMQIVKILRDCKSSLDTLPSEKRLIDNVLNLIDLVYGDF